jgi:hypothetical protein
MIWSTGVAITLNITGNNAGGGVDGQAIGSTNIGTDSFFGFEGFTGGTTHDVINVSAAVTNAITLVGNSGNDTISAGSSSANITVNETGTGASGTDNITLGSGNDTVNLSDSQANTITGGAGEDVFNFTALNQSSNAGGLGIQRITDVDWSNDTLNLTGFFDGAALDDIAINGNLANYLSMSGTNLQIDLDGTAGAYSMTTLANLTGQTNFSSLAALYNNHLVIG